MNDEHRFDRTARTWLEDGPTRAPDRAVDAALATITTTPQERDLRVPWRLPAMSILPRVAAIAVLIAVVGGGALFLLRPGIPGVGGQPTAAPSPTPSPSPSPMALAAYVAARDAICVRLGTETDPLRADILTFGTEITDAQRAAWVAALEAFHDRYVPAIDELAALVPPAELADGRAQNVTDLRDEVALIQQIADRLREGRDADAQVADAATDPIGDRVYRWEVAHVLHPCP